MKEGRPRGEELITSDFISKMSHAAVVFLPRAATFLNSTDYNLKICLIFRHGTLYRIIPIFKNCKNNYYNENFAIKYSRIFFTINILCFKMLHNTFSTEVPQPQRLKVILYT